MPDPYGSDIPTGINWSGSGTYQGEPVPAPGLPGRYPSYLRPIPINRRNVQRVMRAQLRMREPVLQRWLYSTWTAERRAIKYQEIRNALRDGNLSQQWLDQWQQDYSRFVTDVLEPQWKAMAKAGWRVLAEDASVLAAGRVVPFEEVARRMESWVVHRGGELAVNLTDAQHKAVRAIVRHYTYDRPIGPRSFARMLRPVIGLTPKQAMAVTRFRERLEKAGVAERSIINQVENYSARLHRLRAERIARTELAFAHNQGQLETMRAYVGDGTFQQDRVLKTFTTSEDERVCELCGDPNVSGATIGLEETFPGGTKAIPNCMVPPLHPNCRCTIMYELLEPKQATPAPSPPQPKPAPPLAPPPQPKPRPRPAAPRTTAPAPRRRPSGARRTTAPAPPAAPVAEQPPVGRTTMPAPPAGIKPYKTKAGVTRALMREFDVNTRLSKDKKAWGRRHDSDELLGLLNAVNIELVRLRRSLPKAGRLAGDRRLTVLENTTRGIHVLGTSEAAFRVELSESMWATRHGRLSMALQSRDDALGWWRPNSSRPDAIGQPIFRVGSGTVPPNVFEYEETAREAYSSMFRHEYAHTLTTRKIASAWDHMNYRTGRNHQWYESNVSRYAGESVPEQIAECFAHYTSPTYTLGTLPAEIEAVLEQMLDLIR